MHRWLTHNLHLKLISLTLTIVIYLLVAGDRTRQRTWQLDLEVVDIPSGWVLLNEPEPVSVTVQGSARAFSRLRAEGMRIWQIGPLVAGQRVWSLRPEELELPTGLSVVNISPPEVQLQLEPRVEQPVQVQVALRGAVPSGYELIATRVTPEWINVSAPASYFPDLRGIDTETLDVTGMIRSSTRRVALAPQRPFIHWDRDAVIEVSVEIAVVEAQQVYEAIPLQVVGAGQSLCAPVDTTMRITVAGPRAILEQLKVEALFATLDCTSVVPNGPGVYAVEPVLHNLPAALQVTEQSLTTARVRVLEAPPVDAQPPDSAGPAGVGAGADSPN